LIASTPDQPHLIASTPDPSARLIAISKHLAVAALLCKQPVVAAAAAVGAVGAELNVHRRADPFQIQGALDEKCLGIDLIVDHAAAFRVQLTPA
jgi:hypothetical protein